MTMSTPGGSPAEPNAWSRPGGSAPASGPPGGSDGTDEPGVPVPPPGPGVTPPFTAPPADRNRRGLWIGLGVGALVLVLCCAGTLAGFGLLVVGTTRQVQQQATQVVGDYLDALQTGDYETAYAYLCSEAQGNVTAREFATLQEARPRPTAYRLLQPEIGNTIIVPADVRYDDGTSARSRFELEQESGGQELRICHGM
jgi:hypothetical protein